MPSIFSRIIAGEIPAHKIAETEDFIAFLDISPVSVGHTLVVPKEEINYIFDMDEAAYLKLQAFARKLGRALGKVVPCQRVAMAVVGLEVPHVHIHLVALTEGMKFIDFSAKRCQFEPEEMANLAQKIAQALEAEA